MRTHEWREGEDAPRVAVTHVTEDYRGDHSTDVRIAVEVQPGETVEALARRILATRPGAQPWEKGEIRLVDHIEVRLAMPAPDTREADER